LHSFDPKNSTPSRQRKRLLVKHFEIKRRIFGDDEVLGRDVLQTDLNEEDLERLKDGLIQVMPERDAAGRTIICLNLGVKRQGAQ
jgi:hypothetical protein